MFVLHCLLRNIAGYVEAQLEAVAAMLAASTVDKEVRKQVAGHATISQGTEHGGGGSNPKVDDDGDGGGDGGDTAHNKHAAGVWALDDAPDVVRKGVAEADERQLRLVPGLTAVRRLPEPIRELLHDDGIIIGCSKVRVCVWGARARMLRLIHRRLPCYCASSRCRCDACTRPSGAARLRS